MSTISAPPQDPREPVTRLLRDLRSQPGGLSTRDAERRLVAYGPNELRRRAGRRWPRQIVQQLVHPLALLLWVAAAIALASGSSALAIAIAAVVLLNAAFAFVQERHSLCR
jgi:magnesium-transporting ATPase (P-type)